MRDKDILVLRLHTKKKNRTLKETARDLRVLVTKVSDHRGHKFGLQFLHLQTKFRPRITTNQYINYCKKTHQLRRQDRLGEARTSDGRDGVYEDVLLLPLDRQRICKPLSKNI